MSDLLNIKDLNLATRVRHYVANAISLKKDGQAIESLGYAYAAKQKLAAIEDGKMFVKMTDEYGSKIKQLLEAE